MKQIKAAEVEVQHLKERLGEKSQSEARLIQQLESAKMEFSQVRAGARSGRGPDGCGAVEAVSQVDGLCVPTVFCSSRRSKGAQFEFASI